MNSGMASCRYSIVRTLFQSLLVVILLSGCGTRSYVGVTSGEMRNAPYSEKLATLQPDASRDLVGTNGPASDAEPTFKQEGALAEQQRARADIRVPERARSLRPPPAVTESTARPQAQVDSFMSGVPADTSILSLQSLVDILFDFDRASIRPDAREELLANAELLRTKYSGQPFLLEGHCDERGSVEYNLVLGQRRAHAVRQYLVDLGFSPAQFSVVSFGEEKPLCTSHEEACWQKNRRTHFVLQ